MAGVSRAWITMDHGGAPVLVGPHRRTDDARDAVESGRLDAERAAPGLGLCGKLNGVAGPGNAMVAQPGAKRLRIGNARFAETKQGTYLRALPLRRAIGGIGQQRFTRTWFRHAEAARQLRHCGPVHLGSHPGGRRLLNRVQQRGVALGMAFLDGTTIRAHQKAAGADKRGADGEQRDRREALGRSRGGYGTKACVIADGRGRAVAFALAPGQAHELPMGPGLLDCLPDVPGWVVGDRGLASNTFRDRIWDLGARPAIPAIGHLAVAAYVLLSSISWVSSEAAGGGSGEGAPVPEQGERGDGERLGGGADTDQGAVAAQQPQVGVEVDAALRRC